MTFAAFGLAKILALPRTLFIAFAGATATMLDQEGGEGEEASRQRIFMGAGLACSGVAIGLLGRSIQKELTRVRGCRPLQFFSRAQSYTWF